VGDREGARERERERKTAGEGVENYAAIDTCFTKGREWERQRGCKRASEFAVEQHGHRVSTFRKILLRLVSHGIFFLSSDSIVLHSVYMDIAQICTDGTIKGGYD